MKHTLTLGLIATTFVAAFTSTPASAEVYKCRGAHGLVTYQDEPCGVGAIQFVSAPVLAEVYKCGGPRGVVTYQDVPCGAGTIQNVVQIVEDRAYDPPPSVEMARVAAELRNKNRELTERLNRARQERQFHEGERARASFERGIPYGPLPVALTTPYGPSANRFHRGFFFGPPPGAFPYTPFPDPGFTDSPDVLEPSSSGGNVGGGSVGTPSQYGAIRPGS